MSPRRLLRPEWWRRRWSILRDGVVILGVLLILGGLVDNRLNQSDQAGKTEQLAKDLRRAICTLRADRIRAVRSGERFLEEHPQGGADFTRADIVKSLKLQRETIDAFRYAHCPPVPKES